MSNKIATHGVFVGGKQEDHQEIETKLKQLVSARLADLAFGEEKEILTEISQTLKREELSDVINDPNAVSFSISPQEWHWLSRHSQDSWLEYIIYRYRFKVYPALKKLLDYPTYLLIEPTSICNLRCVMCFQSDPKFAKKEYMGTMDFGLFKEIVDQIKGTNCQAVTLSSRGEPLLCDDFGKMLQYLTEAGILDIKLNTNATRLDEEKSHQILSSGISEVVFSVDAATKKTYEEIRRNGNFEQVVANVKRFHEIRAKHYPNSAAVTRISGVKVRDDQDAGQMSDFWSDLVDEVVIKSAIPRWDTYNNERICLEKPCRQLWKQMYVWFDGTVNPCDFDYLSYLSVGNVKKSSIKDIWTSDLFNQLRANHSSGSREKNIPCDRCPLS